MLASGAYQPLDYNGNGMHLGEGSCYFFVEPTDSALERDACIYANIVGYKQNFCPTKANRVISATKCIAQALDSASLSPGQIDLVILSGIGSAGSDIVEISAISNVFNTSQPYITTNHSNIGNTLGAAGAFNILEGLLSIRNNEICPICNLTNPLDHSLNYVTNVIRSEVKNVLITSFDEENNVCLILSKT